MFGQGVGSAQSGINSPQHGSRVSRRERHGPRDPPCKKSCWTGTQICSASGQLNASQLIATQLMCPDRASLCCQGAGALSGDGWILSWGECTWSGAVAGCGESEAGRGGRGRTGKRMQDFSILTSSVARNTLRWPIAIWCRPRRARFVRSLRAHAFRQLGGILCNPSPRIGASGAAARWFRQFQRRYLLGE